MEETLETCRRLYNNSLDERSKNHLSFYEQRRLLTKRRRDDKHLKQIHSQVAQDVLLRLDKAYQAFFKKLARYPKFKRAGKYSSFTYPQHRGGFKFKENRLYLPLIGKMKIRMHRIPIGSLKTCTVIKDIDQWYVCITSDDHMAKRERPLQNSNTIGIDLGLSKLVTLSTGETIKNPKHLDQSIQRIKKLQRNLARKKKGSKNRVKAKIALAKAWRKVRRQRDDYAHKVSAKLATNYDTIVFEKLTIANMVKNHSLAQAIMDATWYKLRQMTAYKVERRDGQVILVNPSGTSQKCSRCGVVAEEKIDLSVRTFECHSCGLVIDRDWNAAINILKLGLEQAHAEAEPLLVRRISKFSRGSKKSV